MLLPEVINKVREKYKCLNKSCSRHKSGSRWFQFVPGSSSSFQVVPALSNSFMVLLSTVKKTFFRNVLYPIKKVREYYFFMVRGALGLFLPGIIYATYSETENYEINIDF